MMRRRIMSMNYYIAMLITACCNYIEMIIKDDRIQLPDSF